MVRPIIFDYHYYIDLLNLKSPSCFFFLYMNSYLNGLLQTLFMTPEFRRAIFTWHYNPSKHGAEEWCIPLQLQKLFGLLQLSKDRAVDTIALTHSFGWEGSEVFQQQDVQELTRVLFDALEETFKGTAVENIIDELYAGRLVDYIRCIDVDYESERVDKCLDFSLAIVPFDSNVAMKSLTECIEMFLRPEILDGDNQYYAEAFQKKVDAIKGLKLCKLPQIMSIQLKRFVFDFSNDYVVQKKLNDIVKFPMILDMNKYVTRLSADSRHRTSSCSRSSSIEGDDGIELIGDDQLSARDEFEAFLMKQIELLRESRRRNEESKTDTETIEGEVVAVAVDSRNGDTGVWGEGEWGGQSAVVVGGGGCNDSDEPTGLNTVGLVSTDENGKGDSVGDDSERPHEMGDNDVKGSQIEYESLSEEAIVDLIRTRGEWVYELYAVLIHSGAISGGHYFAYIKVRW